jgi:hypothetical protein
MAAALAARPRPDVLVVLTDGWTPWPDRRPPAVRLVVGLLVADDPGRRPPEPPPWATTVIVPVHGPDDPPGRPGAYDSSGRG